MIHAAHAADPVRLALGATLLFLAQLPGPAHAQTPAPYPYPQGPGSTAVTARNQQALREVSDLKARVKAIFIYGNEYQIASPAYVQISRDILIPDRQGGFVLKQEAILAVQQLILELYPRESQVRILRTPGRYQVINTQEFAAYSGQVQRDLRSLLGVFRPPPGSTSNDPRSADGFVRASLFQVMRTLLDLEARLGGRSPSVPPLSTNPPAAYPPTVPPPFTGAGPLPGLPPGPGPGNLGTVTITLAGVETPGTVTAPPAPGPRPLPPTNQTPWGPPSTQPVAFPPFSYQPGSGPVTITYDPRANTLRMSGPTQSVYQLLYVLNAMFYQGRPA